MLRHAGHEKKLQIISWQCCDLEYSTLHYYSTCMLMKHMQGSAQLLCRMPAGIARPLKEQESVLIYNINVFLVFERLLRKAGTVEYCAALRIDHYQ